MRSSKKHFLIFLDIDECAKNLYRCQQKCHNTIGSYNCSCFDGFELASDNVTCNGTSHPVCLNMVTLHNHVTATQFFVSQSIKAKLSLSTERFAFPGSRKLFF